MKIINSKEWIKQEVDKNSFENNKLMVFWNKYEHEAPLDPVVRPKMLNNDAYELSFEIDDFADAYPHIVIK